MRALLLRMCGGGGEIDKKCVVTTALTQPFCEGNGRKEVEGVKGGISRCTFLAIRCFFSCTQFA